MPESFGARLRQRREAEGIALNAISEQTKIKLSLLEALERDDVSHWPSGIFRRAFIRAYAAAIGLNPDVVVREFLEVHPDPVAAVAPAAAIAARADDAPAHSAPPTRLRTIVGSAIGSLVRIRRRADDDLGRLEGVPPGAAAVEADLPSAAPDSAPLWSQPAAADSATTDSPRRDAGPEVDFLAFADLCTHFARVDDPGDVQPLLQHAARLLDAVGLIVWIWDPIPAELRPALACGYSDNVLAHLPAVGGDADNATAAAFRSAKTCVIEASGQDCGALAVPLLASGGCAGVLAIELPHGREQAAPVRAAATILAAMLAQLTGGPSAAAASGADDLEAAAVGAVTTPVPAAAARG